MTFKAAKCPNCGGALQVPDDRVTVKCMYCGVDVIVREAIQLAAARVKEFTEAQPIRTKKSFTGGAVASIGCGGLAGAFALAVLAQPGDKTCGGMMLAIAVVFIFTGLTRIGKSIEPVTALQGACPYCKTLLNAAPNVPGTNCPACTKRIVIRDLKFFSVDTPVGSYIKSESKSGDRDK